MGCYIFLILKKTLILLAILVVPSVAYLILHTGKTNFTVPEIYGPKEPVINTINGKQVVDTIYHTVGGFSLLSSDSTLITESVVDGKFSVVDFFFTSCTTICPRMTGQFMRIQDKFRDNNDVVLLSFTVDPEHDTPSILKQYSVKQKAIDNKWYFITGEKKVIYDLARNSYFATTLEGDGGPNDFVHSEKLVLVDKKKQIRGFYDGTDPYETKKLLEDLDILILEDKAASEKKN